MQSDILTETLLLLSFLSECVKPCNMSTFFITSLNLYSIYKCCSPLCMSKLFRLVVLSAKLAYNMVNFGENGICGINPNFHQGIVEQTRTTFENHIPK